MSLEDDFKKTYEENIILINAKVAAAQQMLGEAISIAEANGIPFNSSVSDLSQAYVPDSFKSKWNLDPEILESVGIYVDRYVVGWEHSEVC